MYESGRTSLEELFNGELLRAAVRTRSWRPNTNTAEAAYRIT